MELNLRKARKLEKKIERFISDLKSRIDRSKSIRVNADLQSETIPILLQARTDFNLAIDNIQALIKVKYSIRGMIADANFASGINALIVGKVSLENQISILNSVSQRIPILDLKVLEDEIGITKAQAANGSRFVQSSIDANFLMELDEKEYKQKQLALAKEIEAKEDRLLELNFATKIKLNNKLISLLQVNSLL